MANTAATKRRPFQVYLDDREVQWLEQAAQASGMSRSDVVREGIRRMARELIPVEEDPLWKLIGLAGEDNDMPTDFAEKHDEYLVRWQMEDDGKLPKSRYGRGDDE